MSTLKATILVRIEPGCLGPTGADYIEEFCAFAGPVFTKINAAFLNWQLTPRYDKSLPEIQYHINGRPLSNEKAKQYLAAFHCDIANIEEDISAKLSICIDKFFER